MAEENLARADSGAWSSVLLGLLARWYDGTAPQPTTDDGRLAVERMADLPRTQRPVLLSAIAQRIEHPSWERIHPTWLIDVLPQDPLLRHWALNIFPTALRIQLLDLLGREPHGSRMVTVGPPAWFRAFWLGLVRRRLGFELPLPRADVNKPPTGFDGLAMLEPESVFMLLDELGFRVLADGVSALSHKEVLPIVFSLSPIGRDRLAVLRREGAGLSAGPWENLVRRETEEVSDGASLLERLALGAIAASQAAGPSASLRRFALTLPRTLGRRLWDGRQGLDEDAPDAPSQEPLLDELIDYYVAMGSIIAPRAQEVW